MLTTEHGRRTDFGRTTDVWLYYELTYEPSVDFLFSAYPLTLNLNLNLNLYQPSLARKKKV